MIKCDKLLSHASQTRMATCEATLKSNWFSIHFSIHPQRLARHRSATAKTSKQNNNCHRSTRINTTIMYTCIYTSEAFG